MIVLDTNVLSEAMKPQGKRSEVAFEWMARQPGDMLYLTTITAAEILAGVAVMQAGKRREEVSNAANRVLHLFDDRMLAFDRAAASYFAEASALRRRARLPVDGFDLLIGAIARRHGMAVATRNVYDFEHCGVDLINPWEAESS